MGTIAAVMVVVYLIYSTPVPLSGDARAELIATCRLCQAGLDGAKLSQYKAHKSRTCSAAGRAKRAADCKRRTRWGLIRQPRALLIIRYLHSLAFQGMIYGGVLNHRAECDSRRARIGANLSSRPPFWELVFRYFVPAEAGDEALRMRKKYMSVAMADSNHDRACL